MNEPKAETGAPLPKPPNGPSPISGQAAPDEEQARTYHRAQRVLSVVGFVVDFALLMLLLLAGWSVGFREAAERVSRHPALALLIYLLLLGLLFKIPDLVIGFLKGYWLEHRHGLSRMTFGQWLLDEAKGVAIGAAIGALGAEALYAAIRLWPRDWWVVCAAAFSLFFILLAHLAPVLLFPIFFKFKPVEDSALVARLEDLSRRARTRVRGVYEWKLGEKTKKANAALMGSGSTRRIILSDTLLSNFQPDEIEAVLAHEFGHHVRRHLLWGMLVQTAITFAGFYLANRALARWSHAFGLRGPSDFANLPLLILTGFALSLTLLPALSAFSRRMERQADAYALGSIPDREAFIRSMEKLAQLNLGERRPPRWIEFIFHSHPSIERRIQFAREWNPARRRTSQAGA